MGLLWSYAHVQRNVTLDLIGFKGHIYTISPDIEREAHLSLAMENSYGNVFLNYCLLLK